MKEEMDRLNKLVYWYKLKLNEIRGAPVDSRPRKLEKLCQRSEKNKDLGVTITRAGTMAPVDYPGYPPKLELPEDNEEIVFMMLQQRVHCLLDINHIINSIISKS